MVYLDQIKGDQTMNIAIERKLIHLSKKLDEWRSKLDRAITTSAISEAVQMVRLYESAIIGLEAKAW